MNFKTLGTVLSLRLLSILLLPLAFPADGFLPGQTALASEPVSIREIESLQRAGAFNGLFCIADCGRFFDVGREDFELEIQQLQGRISHVDEADSLLTIDPALLESIEDWQLEAESVSPFRHRHSRPLGR